MIKNINGAWKVFCSAPLESDSINILKIEIRQEGNQLFSSLNEVFQLFAFEKGGYFVEYTWDLWKRESFQKSKFQRTLARYLGLPEQMGITWCSIFEASPHTGIAYTDSKNNLFVLFDKDDEDGRSDRSCPPGMNTGESHLMCKTLHGSACHYEAISETFLCLADNGRLIRIPVRDINFLSTYRYLGERLLGGDVHRLLLSKVGIFYGQLFHIARYHIKSEEIE